MIDTIENIVNAIPAWLNAIALLVTAASGVVALIPNQPGDKFLNKAMRVIKQIAAVMAIDIGHAKPKDMDN